MQNDKVVRAPRGLVKQYIVGNDQMFMESDNTVVDTAFEAVVRSLMGEDQISVLLFALTNNAPITPSTRSLRNTLANTSLGGSDLDPFTSRDTQGLRTVGTWRGIYTPTSSFTYDTLGLVSSIGTLVAATTFSSSTIPAGESVEIVWTLYFSR